MKKSRWRFLKSWWFIAIAVIIVLIVVISAVRSSNQPPNFDTASAQIGTVTELVSVTGSVSPIGKADLAFEKSGVISEIYVKVGDQIKKGDKIASLDDSADRAALASAEATLADMSRSLTPAELAVQESDVASSKTALDSAKDAAVNSFHDAYAKAQGAEVNYADIFFSNPQSANPAINIRVDSTVHQNLLNNERVAVSSVFNQWSSELSQASSTAAASLLADAAGYLSKIKSFMLDLSGVVNAMSTGNSGLSQSAIDSDVASMNSALSALNSAIDAVTTAQSSLTAAQASYDQALSDYNLKLSGNSEQSIAAQAAKVAQAKAVLDQDTLTSPIDGIVTRADPSVGEFAAAGSSGFAVQNSSFKIEAYVPEADIAKVAVGDLASTTLDAYGSDTDFPSQVAMIDPAETVIEGVPTYKVTLYFVTPDARIRSGMTANLDILTHQAADVLEVPSRAITDDNGAKSVNLVSADGKTYSSVPVTIGLKGSDGTTEITSGLNVGDKVVTYIKQ